MNPDQIGAVLMATAATLTLAAHAVDKFATWNRARRATRKANR